MSVYTKKGSVRVNSVKKNLYIKDGGTKKYVNYRKRHISLTKYKKIKMNSGKCRKVKKCTRKSGVKRCRKICK